MDLGTEIIDLCRSLGFALAGVAPARPTDRGAELDRWLAEGLHGSMEWLARHAEVRKDPARVLAGARSIIMVADRYARPGDTDPPADDGPPRGRIARYARGDDYHQVMKRRLHALCDALRPRFPADAFRAFVDTAPVLEREHALRAGLGWIGKHTLLIHPREGSWLLLGGVLTTLGLEPPDGQRPIADHCGTCTRCIDACPTRAITPYAVDARRCISYLTIEHRGPIDPSLHAPMGDWIFGCDICQEVCPHNRPRAADPPREAAQAPLPRHADAPRRASFDLLDVLGWTEQDRRRALSGSSMKRAGLDMWKRNALIAAGNTLRRREHPALRARVEAIATDAREPDPVRDAARGVL
jgi:epoxyqueuosine reductase